ncbi:MAG TPA: ROK family protein [Acidimicrobiales bacterium]|nr:ROK family protein [Acidimicrobiales bacterium]
MADLDRCAIGVDIGGSKVLAVLLGPEGRVEATARLATPVSGGADQVVDAVLAVSAEVAGTAGTAAELPLGVGIPGMVDRSGVARFCPHLHSVDGVDLRAELAQPRAPASVTTVLNDATAACWAEHIAGAGEGFDDMLMVTLGTGIGGGAVFGGRLVEGAHGFAGEIGHMVIDPHGPPCPCGKRGCWERFASGSALGRLAREAAEAGTLDRVVALAGGDPEAVRGEHVTAAALAGDRGARAVMENFAWWLALGLANLANALDPAAIVLGGGLMQAGDVVMAPLKRAFAELAEAADARGVELRAAALREQSGAIGAAMLARAAAGSPS